MTLCEKMTYDPWVFLPSPYDASFLLRHKAKTCFYKLSRNLCEIAQITPPLSPPLRSPTPGTRVVKSADRRFEGATVPVFLKAHINFEPVTFRYLCFFAIFVSPLLRRWFDALRSLRVQSP
jgi:hypothetical protein